MCAIVDANVAGEVFGQDYSPAGEAFLKWLSTGKGHLVAGGELLRELERSRDFKQWAKVAVNSGRMTVLDDELVTNNTQGIERAGECESNDAHVLAVAQVGGARLLYSNDRNLQKDFKNPKLVNEPRGKVYQTVTSRQYKRSHRELLAGATCRRLMSTPQ